MTTIQHHELSASLIPSDNGHAGEGDGDLERRVWTMIHGPIQPHDAKGRAVHLMIQTSVVGFIAIVILETDDYLYESCEVGLHVFAFIFAIVLTAEYALSVWSVPATAPFKGKPPMAARCRWATWSLPMVDLVVLVAFWTNEYLRHVGKSKSAAAKYVGVFETLRLLRLLRIFDVFEGGRVQKATRLMARVVQNKGEDLLSAMITMFVSLIFIATAMYLVEGRQDDGEGPIDNFSSIPISMYWGVITLTTIGYGDIYPRTTAGRVLCCFVGFFAVCVGSIPIGIIGAGYVEELERSRREEKLEKYRLARGQGTSRRPLPAGDATGGVAGGKGLDEPSAAKSSSGGGPQMADFGSETAEALVGLRRYLGRLRDPAFVGALKKEELAEVAGLLSSASLDMTSFFLDGCKGEDGGGGDEGA